MIIPVCFVLVRLSVDGMYTLFSILAQEPSSIATVLGFCKPLDDSVNETPKQEQDPYSVRS